MYKLYWRQRSGAFAPAAVLAELNIPTEMIPLDKATRAHESAEFRAVNPMGQMPALVLPGGEVMTESAAIVLYLADAHPESGLAPAVDDSRRAPFLRWLFFSQCNIYETDLRYTYADRYTADPDGASGVRDAAYGRLDRLWDILADAMDDHGPFFFGPAFTALDIYLAMLGTWHFDPPALYGRWPAVERLVRAVAARPAIAPVWRAYAMGGA